MARQKKTFTHSEGASTSRRRTEVFKLVFFVGMTILALVFMNSMPAPDTSVSSLSLLHASMTTNGKSPGKYAPFSCPNLLDELRKNPKIQQLDPNEGVLYGRRTVNEPLFYVFLHNQAYDRARWDIMTHGFYYEVALAQAFKDVLKASPSGSRVLDVGGNIGYFTLLSAASGPFIIDTFEPNLKNRMRFCESLSANRWFHTEFDPLPLESSSIRGGPVVNPYAYGVGEKEGTFQFTEHETNPGMGAVSDVQLDPSNPKAIQTVTLDNFARERGWFESRPNIAILKVDVEGFEYSVFNGAKELLKNGMVQNVFMEISARTEEESKANIPLLEFLSKEAGYRLHKTGGWSGPAGEPKTWPNDAQLVGKIQKEAEEAHAKQLNMWWKRLL